MAATTPVVARAADIAWLLFCAALSLSGTTRLLVRSRPNELPEGVLSDFDLVRAAAH